MKVQIEETGNNQDIRILISCRKKTTRVEALQDYIMNYEETLIAVDKENALRVSPSGVFYFEALENKVFIYEASNVYETHMKLYEIEEAYGGYGFFRASKSMVLSIHKIRSVRPYLDGRFEATLKNDEKVIISRKYVKTLKSQLGI